MIANIRCLTPIGLPLLLDQLPYTDHHNPSCFLLLLILLLLTSAARDIGRMIPRCFRHVILQLLRPLPGLRQCLPPHHHRSQPGHAHIPRSSPSRPSRRPAGVPVLWQRRYPGLAVQRSQTQHRPKAR